MAKSLPDEFPPEEESYSLYEGIEYQEFWDNRQLSRQDVLEQHILLEMLPASGTRILDLGCGYGRLAPCYVDRFDQSVLCDGSLSLLRDAQKSWGGRAILVAADISRLPFRDALFDCVLTIRVLQHVHDLRATLEAVHRVMSTGGSFVFSYHNKRNVKTIPRHFATRGDANPFSLEPTEPVPTLISRHPNVVEGILRDSGFSPPEYQGTAIFHPFASLTDRLGRRAPAGAGWAEFMGRHRLAPWLIGESTAIGGGPVHVAQSELDLFVCPICNTDLESTDRGLRCSPCARSYPVDDGIFDFRV